MSHPFICPNCGERSLASDRYEAFRRDERGCSHCGFSFLFELLDDYYPAPDAAFFVADKEGRVIGCGRGSFELTGFEEEEVVGQQISEALGLSFDTGEDHVATVLEWGVRALGKTATLRTENERAATATADLFPAYDDDGGLLLVLTPSR
jgi:PAS domain-containing protein